jgi:hypothetical protein
LEGEGKAIAQAKAVGATVVLVNTNYTDTRTATIPLFVPTASTTTESGTISGTGGYATYTGTSTTTGSTIIPYTTSTERFDHYAVFFVKSTTKLRYGISLGPLTPEIRQAIRRNTGALVEVVFEDTPAFRANILIGDILVAIDGGEVASPGFAMERLREAQSNPTVLTVLRDGKQIDVPVPW